MCEKENQKLPKYLYKYIDWEKLYHRRMLADREFFFAKPSSFNDPFDCLLEPDYSLLNKAQIYKIYISHLKRDLPMANRSEIRKRAKDWQKKGLWKNEANKKRSEEWSYNYKNENLGLFCLSSKHDEILMWSHYAKGHSGLCLQFDTKRLMDDFENQLIVEGKLFEIIPIEYHLDMPIINPSEEGDDYFKRLVTIKAKRWEYENEYRIVLLGFKDNDKFLENNERIYKYPSKAITGVYFGYNTTIETEQSIMAILREGRIQPYFFKSKVKKNKFELEFIQIN
ncbi:MAG: DUF2971 domain-containing protein [Candidatus Zixiibacteriota bacterium]